jgi:hypothetical protein
MSTTARQCGHLPFLPAAEAGVRTSCPHWAQKNSITGAAAGAGAGRCGVRGGGGSFLGGGRRAGAGAAGICTTARHCGHLPLLPAAESGVRTNWRHDGQANSIGIPDEPEEPKNRRTKEPKNQRTEEATNPRGKRDVIIYPPWFFGSSVLRFFQP